MIIALITCKKKGGGGGGGGGPVKPVQSKYHTILPSLITHSYECPFVCFANEINKSSNFLCMFFFNHSVKNFVGHYRGPIRGFRDTGYLGKKLMG